MNNNRGSYSSYQQQRYGGSTSPSAPTIKNPSAHFDKGTEFNDRDRLNDMLATEKWLTDGFNVFVLHVLTETHHACRDVFNLMFEKGWYSLHPENPSHIADHYQKFSGYESQFPTQGSGTYQTGAMYPPRDY